MNSEHQPTVSVIIPVYNGEAYIREAIESVLNQTFKDLEIIVIDDGSTDGTKNVLMPYMQTNKIKYYYQANRGLSAARNAGIKVATGKYLKFLDCDDVLYPEQIRLQVEHLMQQDNIISLTDHAFYFENGETRIKKIILGKSNPLARLIIGNFIPVHNILVQADLVVQAGGFDEELSALEDADLWLRLLIKGVRVEKVDYVGCGYRIVRNSLSSNADKMFFMRCRVSEKLNALMLPRLNQIDQEIFEALLVNNSKLIEGCIARGLRLEQYLSKTLVCMKAMSSFKGGLRKLLFSLIGCHRYIRLKYVFNCFRDGSYKDSLLYGETKWRNSTS